jgi:hypothetical protein
MVRSKKGDDKSKESGTLSIDVDSFIRMRDSVRHSSLLHSSHHSISALHHAYIAILKNPATSMFH